MERVTSEEIGRRIARRRKETGISQAELAKVIDRDPSVVSKIEAGERRLNSFELALVAEALHTTADDLLGRNDPMPAMRVAARLGSVEVAAEVEPALKRLRRIFEVEALLDRIAPAEALPRPPALAPPRKGQRAVDQGASLAAEVREVLGLGDAPIVDLAHLIETKLGMDVAYEKLPEGVNGLCVQVAGAALAVANAGEVPDRRRFTLAHEVCHRLCGDAEELVVERLFSNTQALTEMRANAFAAHFLMPPSGVRKFLGDRNVTPIGVARVMFEFGVSLPAATWHLMNIGLLTEAARQQVASEKPGSLFYSAGLWTEWKEALKSIDVPRPPGRIQERAIRAYVDGQIGIGPIADLFDEEDAERLREELREDGIVPEALEAELEPAWS